MKKANSVWILAASWCVSCLLQLGAQTLDTGVLGTVSDPQGSVIPAASVTINNKATGVSRVVKTSAEGTYEVRYLVPGEYVIEAQSPGFRTERRVGVIVQINQQARIDFRMQVGEVQQAVDVTAAAPLLQTENATLGE